MAADIDLLFGLLSLQNGLVNQGQLVAAFQAWTLDRSRSLADHLEARGDLDDDDRHAVEALVARHLKKHGGDPQKSLAAIPAGPATRESLAGIADPVLEASLARIDPGHDGDADRTASYTVGMVTGGGGRFRVLRPHARGGLGAVFVALDVELNREVALKQILDHHADDAVSRRRFLVEAEITGGLEHPGIVPVYGLGAYDDGRPYYAMRFIKGDSLKEAIELFHTDQGLKTDASRRSLALRELLRRFIDVCNAIEYAHSRGVLHRDIKPANIIVGKHGETLIVDWGLAKPLGRVELAQQIGERTLVLSSGSGSSETMEGSALGTPAYMSPEQAGGQLDRLGPWSDVYSLGATLYCLLTGRPPIEGEDVGGALRKAQRGEFNRPTQLDPTLDGALEAVCLKAMALAPEDRYATCRGLAEDVARWMADEPVTAWGEPLARRARRWARRNRTAVTAGAVAVVVALCGSAAVLAVQTQANGRLQRANNHLASANTREKQRFELALQAIRLFHGEVGDDLVLKAAQFKPLRDKLLVGATSFYGKLAGLLDDQPDRGSRQALGDAYFELGELTAKIGDKPAALAAHRNGLAVRRQLSGNRETDVRSQRDLAESLLASAILSRQTGSPAQAFAYFDEATVLLEATPITGPGSSELGSLLGRVYMSTAVALAATGKPAAAMTAYERSVQTLKRLASNNPTESEFRSRLADTLNNLGILQLQTGKPEEAIESHRRALAIQQKLVNDDPAGAEFRSRLALTIYNIGALEAASGKTGDALATYRRALEMRQKLADDNPAISEYQTRLADTFNNIANLHGDIGEPGEALKSHGRALAIRQKLADENPAVADFRNRLADSHTGIGWLLMQMGKPADAVGEFSREEAIRTRLVQESPSTTSYRDRLANCQTNAATAFLRLGRPTEAQALCRRAVALRDALVKDHPAVPGYQRGLGESLLRSGQARRDQGDVAGAAADWKRADGLLEGAGPLNLEFTIIHACCHASLFWAAGQPASDVPAREAGTEADRAIALLQHAVDLGCRDLSTYHNETALDPLRGRDDFRTLMLNIAFPAKPFAP